MFIFFQNSGKKDGSFQWEPGCNIIARSICEKSFLCGLKGSSPALDIIMVAVVMYLLNNGVNWVVTIRHINYIYWHITDDLSYDMSNYDQNWKSTTDLVQTNESCLSTQSVFLTAFHHTYLFREYDSSCHLWIIDPLCTIHYVYIYIYIHISIINEKLCNMFIHSQTMVYLAPWTQVSLRGESWIVPYSVWK